MLLAVLGALLAGAAYAQAPFPSRPITIVVGFAPVAMAVAFPNVLVVHPSVPAANLADFIKLAREKPGVLNYGSAGIGSLGHLAGEMLK